MSHQGSIYLLVGSSFFHFNPSIPNNAERMLDSKVSPFIFFIRSTFFIKPASLLSPAGGFFTTGATWEGFFMESEAKVAQSCPTLWPHGCKAEVKRNQHHYLSPPLPCQSHHCNITIRRKSTWRFFRFVNCFRVY